MPVKSDERLRLERLLINQELLIKRAFASFLKDARSDEVMAEISRHLERRNIESALRIIDSFVFRFSTVLPRAFQRAARLEMENSASVLRPLTGAVALVFDPTDFRAAALMRKNQMSFVRGFSQEQRKATTIALAGALATGDGPSTAARAFRDSIGLTAYQERAVLNYRSLLRAGSAEALTRDLRDRRFDPSLRSGKPLEAAQIDRMSARYRERYIMMRSETIARTESTKVTSLARREAFRQTADDVGLNRGRIVRVWNATQDERTRDSHADMDGQEVAFDEPFISGLGNSLMFPGDPAAPAEDVINCRCVVTNRVEGP